MEGGVCTHCGQTHEALPRCPVTGAPSRRPGPVGTTFGSYTVERWIGGGGFAGVYRARDTRSGDAVALKLLHIERVYQGDSHERLLRESRSAGALSHPHVVRVLDAGVHEDDRPYLVMELVEGQDLQSVLDEEVALSPERAIRVALQILDALEAAHAQGIVHRDIKPANVMLEGGRDFVKLLDFGLSTLPSELGSTRITGTGMAMGTPGYMSPEQHLSTRDVDHRADLYSVAVILFRALSGRMPFHAETHAQLVLEVFTNSPPPLTSVVKGIPEWLGAAVDRGLARDRDARWPSAMELASALRAEPPPALAPTLLLDGSAPPASDTISGAGPTTIQPRLPTKPPGVPSSSRTVRGAFIGREAQLAELARLFDDGARLVTLLGPGGVGKTRLAERFASDATTVELAEHRTHGEVCAATLRALGEGPGPDPESAVARVLAHRGQGVLVLDNLEQVVDQAAPAIARWVEEASGWRFLVTSQRRLDVAAEQVLELPPLPLPAAEDDPLEADAVRLLVDRVRRQRRDYAPDEAEATRLAELARLLDGIPLALELAAPRLAMLGTRELLRRMKDRFGALSSSPGATGRHRTLQQAIRWSWELLSEAERKALAQCSVFRGGFTALAAEEVLAFDPSLPSLDALSALRDRSLLFMTPEGEGMPRLGCYQSIREFAAARLRESGQQDATRQRHAAFYARLGYRLAEVDDPDLPEAQRNAQLARELDNLVEAVRFFAQDRVLSPQDATLAAMGLIALSHGAHYGLDVTLAAQLFDDALLRVESALPVHFRARLFRARGLLSMAQGDFAGSAAHFERSREEATIQGDAEMAGLAMLGRGAVLSQLGRAEEGRDLIETSIELLRGSHDVGAKALALARLGVVEFVAQNHERARAALEESIPLFERTGRRHLLGMAECNLGLVLQRQGELDLAAERYEQAIAHGREAGSEVTTAFVTGTFASLRHVQGRLEEAEAMFEEAERLAEPHPTYHRCVIAGYRALLDIERGHATAARLQLDRAAPKLESPGDDDRWTYLSFRAVLPALDGELDASERALDELLAQIPEDHYRDRAIAQAQHGHIAARRGDVTEAERRLAMLATQGPNGEPAPVTHSLEARLALRLLQTAIDAAKRT